MRIDTNDERACAGLQVTVNMTKKSFFAGHLFVKVVKSAKS